MLLKKIARGFEIHMKCLTRDKMATVLGRSGQEYKIDAEIYYLN